MICPKEVKVKETDCYPIVCDICDKLLNAVEYTWYINGHAVEGYEETEFYEEACPKCNTPLHLKRWHSIDYRDVDAYADHDEDEMCATCGKSLPEEDEGSFVCKSCQESKTSNSELDIQPSPEVLAWLQPLLQEF